MRIAVVTAFPPSRDNLKVPSALPYTLLQFTPSGSEVFLFYFKHPSDSGRWKEIYEADISALNLRKAEEIPDYRSTVLRFHTWRIRCQGLPHAVALYSVRRNVIGKIRSIDPDLVWLYPHWLIDWVSSLRGLKIVVTGPDCSTLHFERLMKFVPFISKEDLSIYQHALNEAKELERAWGKTDALVHVVGREDQKRFVDLTGRPEQVKFCRHPHHHFLPLKESLTSTKGKIKILITGGVDVVYTGNHLQKLVKELIRYANELNNRYSFILIGSGYAQTAEQLSSAGYEVHSMEWVSDFASTIASGQIQIFPIAVGTGTKGKVLSALATGLLGIGSEFSFENIQIDVPGDALVYKEPEEIAVFLLDILDNLCDYEAMARRASIKVKTAHSPELVSKAFWKWALKG